MLEIGSVTQMRALLLQGLGVDIDVPWEIHE